METRVFEKFTRGEKESAKPGIGLGLAICRAIVEAHGGSIGAVNRMSAATDEAARSRVEGARFWFTLPVETPPDVPDLPEAADAPDAPDALQDQSAEDQSADNMNPNPLAKPTHE